MKETSQQIASSLKEKIGSPIFGSFLLSCLALNWKMVIILFASELDAIKKIGIITESYSLWSILLYPLIFSIIVAMLSPLLQNIIQLIKDKLEIARQHILLRQTEELRMRKAETDIAIENMKLSADMFKESFKQRVSERGEKFNAEDLDMELERFLSRSSMRHRKFLR